MQYKKYQIVKIFNKISKPSNFSAFFKSVSSWAVKDKIERYMNFGFEIKYSVVNVFYMYNDEKLSEPNQNLFQTHDACPNNVFVMLL